MNSRNTYEFVSKFGTIRTIKADMNWVREQVSAWELENPPPEIPIVEMKVSDLNWSQSIQAAKMRDQQGISMIEAKRAVIESIGGKENPKDPEYILALNRWEQSRWAYSEYVMVWNYTLIPLRAGHGLVQGVVDDCATPKEIRNADAWAYADTSVLSQARGDRGTDESPGDCILLYRHIINTSELTYGAVLEAARMFRNKKEREADTRVHRKRTKRATGYHWVRVCGGNGDRFVADSVPVYAYKRAGKHLGNMAVPGMDAIFFSPGRQERFRC